MTGKSRSEEQSDCATMHIDEKHAGSHSDSHMLCRISLRSVERHQHVAAKGEGTVSAAVWEPCSTSDIEVESRA